MELDRWKDCLHGTGPAAGRGPDLAREDLAAVLNAGIRKSRRAVARALALELAGIVLLYALVAAMALFVGPLRSFHVKIIVLSAAGIAPVVFFFGRYFAAGRADLGRPIVEVLEESRRRLKASLIAYRWGGLALSAAMAAALWTDAAFRRLPAGWKWGSTVYVLAIAALSFPYLRVVYGRRLLALEELNRETRETGNGPDFKSVP